jgi:hypothetical protein
MSRENMLKSEALLTLSLQTHFSLEANSAPTLHRENDKSFVHFFRVAALFAGTVVLKRPVVWHLSRPNPSLHRTRWPRSSMKCRAGSLPRHLRRHRLRAVELER